MGHIAGTHPLAGRYIGMEARASREERFARRYAGKGASSYERARAGDKWDAEEAAFDELYGRVRPRSVLDCPVGTGRFIDRYARDGVSALGVDLSEDMLAEAREKVPPGAHVRLLKANVLDPAHAERLGRDHDLVVCVRFVYAVEKSKLQGLFRTFSQTGAKHLLVGMRVWPEGTTWGTYFHWYVWNSAKGRPRGPRHWRRYVSRESTFRKLIEDCGWEVVDSRSVQEPDPVGKYFYLLRNTTAS